MKVVTLLPSATEIVWALGCEESLVGVSHSCKYPAGVRDLPRMTRTHIPYWADSATIDTSVRRHLNEHEALYDLDVDALAAVAPDVIVSQALCDVCAVATGDVIAAIAGLPSKPTLVDLNPHTLDDVFTDILRVGQQLDAGSRARELVTSLAARRDAVAGRTAGLATRDRPRVAFLEWLLPPFSGGHWNPEIVGIAGGIDVLGAAGRASRTLSWERIVASSPEVLFIACCGFDIDRALTDVGRLSSTDAWQSLRAATEGRVFVADGNAFFSSPGPRLIDGLEIIAHALHPDIHPQGRGLAHI